ncbi:MAG: hypothetical protein IJ782_02005 [Prevotella sp.]|nr:hypothetical protein [Prevotella sp.]
MDPYKELAERLKNFGVKDITVVQGIVTAVSGNTCSVEVGNIVIPGVRLRASESEKEGEMLIVPKVGSAVLMGSLSGDFTQVAVLAVDEVESITINGGKLGGLINIQPFIQALNSLITAFNSHTHTGTHGVTSAPIKPMEPLRQADYEDKKISH